MDSSEQIANIKQHTIWNLCQAKAHPKSIRRATCMKLLTLQTLTTMPRAHFKDSTTPEIIKNGRGPYRVRRNPPAEKQENKSVKAFARITWISDVTCETIKITNSYYLKLTNLLPGGLEYINCFTMSNKITQTNSNQKKVKNTITRSSIFR